MNIIRAKVTTEATTEAFSQMSVKFFSDLKVGIKELSPVYAGANRETTFSKIKYAVVCNLALHM